MKNVWVCRTSFAFAHAITRVLSSSLVHCTAILILLRGGLSHLERTVSAVGPDSGFLVLQVHITVITPRKAWLQYSRSTPDIRSMNTFVLCYTVASGLDVTIEVQGICRLGVSILLCPRAPLCDRLSTGKDAILGATHSRLSHPRRFVVKVSDST